MPINTAVVVVVDVNVNKQKSNVYRKNVTILLNIKSKYFSPPF